MISMIDRNATWENSEELRAAIKGLLINWAWHFGGGGDWLGYPDHTNFTTPPKREKPRPSEYLGPEDAERCEWVFRRSALLWCEDEPTSLQALAKSLRPGAYRKYLRIEFVLMPDRADHVKAEALGISRRTYRRRIDESMKWFWEQYRT